MSNPISLSPDQIVEVWESMSGGPDGYLKSFGYMQFAQAILDSANLVVSQQESGEKPVLWYEAEEKARGVDLHHVVGSMLYSTRIHSPKPETGNPVWPLYTRPATQHSAPTELPVKTYEARMTERFGEHWAYGFGHDFNEKLKPVMDEEIADLRVALSASQSAPNDLHKAIMNIPLTLPNGWDSPGTREVYATGHRDARHAAAELASAASSTTQKGAEPSEQVRERAMEAVAEALGDAMDCTRVWSAWGYGTMREDDFVQVAGDAGRLAEIADAAIAAIQATAAQGKTS